MCVVCECACVLACVPAGGGRACVPVYVCMYVYVRLCVSIFTCVCACVRVCMR